MASMTPGTDPGTHPTCERGGAVVLLALSLSILGAALLVWRSQHRRARRSLGSRTDRRRPSAERHEQFPLAELPASEFLNTGADARYVGSERCLECHQDDYHAYRETGMGRSLDLLDPANEPSDVVFDHDKSGTSLQGVPARRADAPSRDDVAEKAGRTAAGHGGPPHPVRHRLGTPFAQLPARDRRISGRVAAHLVHVAPSVGNVARLRRARASWLFTGRRRQVACAATREAAPRWTAAFTASRSTRPGSAASAAMARVPCTSIAGAAPRDWQRRPTPERSITQSSIRSTWTGTVLSRSVRSVTCEPTAGVMARGRTMDDFRPGLPLDLFRDRLSAGRGQFANDGRGARGATAA
jgi:hypothetical protein